MTTMQLFLTELENEAPITRKMLELVPDTQYSWKPHAKSMELGTLAGHIAELPTWVHMVMHTTELDFENNAYAPAPITNNIDLMQYFEKNLAAAREELTGASEEHLEEPWVLRSGAAIYMREPKRQVLRVSLSQIIHHRAQLGVYLRLLDIPIPGSYGPSADDQGF